MRYKRISLTKQKQKAEANYDEDAAANTAAADKLMTSLQQVMTLAIIYAAQRLKLNWLLMTAELQSLRTENIKLISDVAHLSPTYDQSAFVCF